MAAKLWACRCGATYKFPSSMPVETEMKLLEVIRREHDGEGHGECDLETARRARQKVERARR